MTPTTSSPTSPSTSPGKFSQMLNKVPEVTLYFWIIKILCTTVGETASDFLSTKIGLGLTTTMVITGATLLTVLFFQFRAKKYIPSIYWLAVVLISVVGTQITDTLVDSFGIPLEVTTALFGIALVATFAVWYAFEKTLSIHSIFTTRREAFYWLAILFTFALGTSAGDMVAESLNFGYLVSALMFGGVIALITAVYFTLKHVLPSTYRWHKFNSILAFWLAYILTRPLGASIGDYLSQATTDGGLGLGTTATSLLFLGTILGFVAYLSYSVRTNNTSLCPEENQHKV